MHYNLFSAKQALVQATLNAIQEFNGSDRESTISWLYQVELVAERTGFGGSPMFTYSNISQQDNESATQYLVRAKVLLEHIHCTSKLSDI